MDVKPTDKKELLRRDREFRDSVSKMDRAERRNLKDTIAQTFKVSPETAAKWMSPTAKSTSSGFRSMFSYNKNPKSPDYIKTKDEFKALPNNAKKDAVQIPNGLSKADAIYEAKLRFGEAVVNGKEFGEVNQKVEEGIKNGNAIRGMGNSVTGLDDKRLYRYLFEDNLFKKDRQTKLIFQKGGSVYVEYFHDSPESQGEELDYEDYEDSDLIDYSGGFYG